jgi:hypothetical protein
VAVSYGGLWVFLIIPFLRGWLFQCVEALNKATILLCAVVASVRWIAGFQDLGAVHYADA